MLPEFLQRVIDTLERLNVPYAVTGSWASTAYGLPRTTHDLDLVVNLHPDQVEALATSFESPIYADRAWMQVAIARGEMFNIIEPASGLKVDCWPLAPGPYAQAQFGRRRQVQIADRVVWMLAPEDVILAKLRWYRETASDTQWRDVVGVIKLQAGDLDEAYLVRWATELGVSELLVRAREFAN